jgi:hypothetical protein
VLGLVHRSERGFCFSGRVVPLGERRPTPLARSLGGYNEMSGSFLGFRLKSNEHKQYKCIPDLSALCGATSIKESLDQPSLCS